MTLQRSGAFALIALAALALFVVAPAHAEGLAKGSSILSFQLTTGTADLASPEDGFGNITAYDHSEWGGQIQFQRLLSDDWALALSGGIGTFSETDVPGDNAAPGDEDFKYTQSSVQFRLGADRFVHISPTFHLFVGPGLQYWSGDSKRELGDESIETGTTTRWAFNGRMGAHVGLGDSFGLEGHIGHYFGFANAEDQGAEVSWTPSGFESAVGIAFKL
jgi:hypothetical protein